MRERASSDGSEEVVAVRPCCCRCRRQCILCYFHAYLLEIA